MGTDESFFIDNNTRALVDPDDYNKFNCYSWSKSNGYIAAYVNGKTTYLHRLILDVPAHLYVDHINGDKLDNRKCNLRIVTPSQNQHNRNVSSFKKSGLPKGVGIRNGLYTAKIKSKGTTIYLGSYVTVQEAEFAYKNKANELQGIYSLHNSRGQEHGK